MHRLFKPLTLAILLAAPALTVGGEKSRTYGWREQALILPENIQVTARLDTGTGISSLVARGLERFERYGEPWVRFKLRLKDPATGKKRSLSFERRVLRETKARRRTGEKRLVVNMALCIGDQRYENEFVLNNKSRAREQILFGRPLLERLGTVDAARSFTVQPNCPKAALR